jgi:hypothetical protein
MGTISAPQVARRVGDVSMRLDAVHFAVSMSDDCPMLTTAVPEERTVF